MKEMQVTHRRKNQDQKDTSKSTTMDEILHIYHQNEDNIHRNLESFDEENLHTMDTSKSTTYLYSMKILVKIQNPQKRRTQSGS